MRGEAAMNAEIKFKKDGRLKIFVNVEPSTHNQNQEVISYKIVEKREGDMFKVSMKTTNLWSTVFEDNSLEFIFGTLGI